MSINLVEYQIKYMKVAYLRQQRKELLRFDLPVDILKEKIADINAEIDSILREEC